MVAGARWRGGIRPGGADGCARHRAHRAVAADAPALRARLRHIGRPQPAHLWLAGRGARPVRRLRVLVDGNRTLLWETGLGDRFAGGRETPKDPGWRVSRTLRSQLAEMGIEPSAITYLAISHMHADHTGNANDYASATWLVQEAERDFAFRPGQDTSSYRALADARATVLHGDHDVFGDGVAMLISTPGHTPGHQSLLVKLPHAGAIVLSGDLYHYPEERAAKTFPGFELDRAKTAASRDAVDALIERLHAQLWIEHDILGYARLKKAPAYYD